MKKNPEQTKMTQSNFQEAFWTLYAKQSIDEITVKDICNIAGYNRSTFYQYYADVYDVLRKFEDRFLDEVGEFVLKLVKQANSLDASQTNEAVFELLTQNNKYISVLFGPHGDAEFTQKIVETLKPIWIKYFFRTDQYTPAEVDLLMEHYISGLLSMFRKWFFDQNGISVERIVQLSYQTLPDVSYFDSFDKELR
jgi:hypothetical protein